MTSTVRSVDVHLNAMVSKYIADIRMAGAETNRAFMSSQTSVRGLNTELATLDKRTQAVDQSTRSLNTRVSAFNTRAAKMTTSLGGMRDGLRDVDTRLVGMNGTGRGSITAFGNNSQRTGAQIDRLSGRLHILAQAAAVLGPTLVPLGAGAVPVLAGLTAGLGTAAGAAGVLVLALNGIGDGLDAVNDYQLEPTAENLQAMRIELERLGPAGAEFVRYLDSIGPELTTLQMAAREGFLPGAEEGIENLLELLPRARSIISDLAVAMGDLAADAGADLAGPEWEKFFRYLDTQAGPLLTEFMSTLGNFGQGFANVLVGLGPLTSDFSGGLLDMSESFAQWSATVGSNQDFQGFLDYVREAGPQALDFIGSLIMALASIVEAAAPIGSAVLPVLTSLLDIIGSLADSPLGTIFLTAAAAMSVYSRGAALAEAVTKRVGVAATTTGVQVTRSSAMYRQAATGAGILANNYGKVAAAAGIMALAYTDVDDKAGLSNTAMLALAGSMAGPWGAAAGAAIGATMDLAAANDDLTASLEDAQSALLNGTQAQQARAYRDLKAQIDDTKRAQDEFWDIDTSVADNMQAIMGWLGDADEKAGATLLTLGQRMKTTGDLTDILSGQVGQTGDQIRLATGDVRAFTGALAAMSGWLDKRAALREYEQNVRDFGKALKDGFDPKDVELLDQMAAGILQVATQIQNPQVKADFLANARESLEKFAGKGPKAEAAVGRVLEKFEKFGLMKANPDLDVDSRRADQKLDRTSRDLRDLDNFRATPRADADTRQADRKLTSTQQLGRALAGLPINPRVNVNNSQANGAIAETRRQLQALDGDVATTYIRTMRTTITNQAGPAYNAGAPSADGSTVPKTGLPYADRHPYLLADGEEVISNRRGQADMNRSALKAANRGEKIVAVGRLADGGTTLVGSTRPTGGSQLYTGPGGRFDLAGMVDGLASLTQGLQNVTKEELRRRNAELAMSTRIFEREIKHREDRIAMEVEADKARLDAMVDAQRSFSEAVSSNFRSDVFGYKAPNQPSTPDNFAALSPEAQRAYLDAQYASSQGSIVSQQQSVVSGDIARAQEALRLYRVLRSRGFDGPAFQELAAKGDVETLRAYAALPPVRLQAIEAQYELRDRLADKAGKFAGNAEFGQAVRALRLDSKESLAEQRAIKVAAQAMRNEIEQLRKELKPAAREAGKALGQEVNDAIVAGNRG